MFGVETKLKESTFKSNNQINSAVTTRTWFLSKEWIRTWPNIGLVSEWKNGAGTRLFELQLFFFRVHGYCIVLTKINTMRCCQCNFSGIFKGRQIITEPNRNSKYPIRCLLDAIWNQTYENLFKHLRWSVFAQVVNSLKSLTGHAKTLHLRCLKRFWMYFYWKARQVQGVQIELSTLPSKM